MKNVIVTAVILLSTWVSAQEEPRTLLGSNEVKSWGVAVGGGIQNGQLFNESVWFANVRAGVVLNQSWTLGGAFGQSLNYISPNYNSVGVPVYGDFEFMHYGAFIEYRLKPNNLIHLSFPLNLGVFEADFDAQNVVFTDWDDAERFSFFVEPGVNLELNVHKYVRLHTGVSYRFLVTDFYTDGLNLPNTNDHFLWNVGVKIGIFKLK